MSFNTFEKNWPDNGTTEIGIPDRPTVPDGVHTLQISRAELAYARSEKKKDPEHNPDGEVIKVAMEKKGHSWVWDEIPLHWRSKVEMICRAARIEVNRDTKVTDVVTHLTGKFVNAEIIHRMGGPGGDIEYVNVARYMDGGEPLPISEKKPPQTRAKKELEKFPNDDIPF